MTCPRCGIDTSDDMDPVYVTFIPRGLGKLNIEAPTCAACAVVLRGWLQEGATAMEDREIESRGQGAAPRQTSPDYWASIGLTVNA